MTPRDRLVRVSRALAAAEIAIAALQSANTETTEALGSEHDAAKNLDDAFTQLRRAHAKLAIVHRRIGV